MTTTTATRIQPYLLFDGNCREAFEYYRDVLHAEIDVLLTYAGSPAEPHVPAEWRDRVLHASLRIDGEVLMASDAPPEHQEKIGGFAVSLALPSAGEAERVFKALSEDGRVIMPFAKTFFAERFGQCVDRFGVPWMVTFDAGA